jgi:hypothetical protein
VRVSPHSGPNCRCSKPKFFGHRSNEASKRLDDIPGVGPALATALVASVSLKWPTRGATDPRAGTSAESNKPSGSKDDETHCPLLLPVALSLGDIPAPVVVLPGVPEPSFWAPVGVWSTPLRLGSLMSEPELPRDVPVLPVPGLPVPAPPVPAAPPPWANAKEEVARKAVSAATMIFFMGVSSVDEPYQPRPRATVPNVAPFGRLSRGLIARSACSRHSSASLRKRVASVSVMRGS